MQLTYYELKLILEFKYNNFFEWQHDKNVKQVYLFQLPRPLT
jgi:hypothetical protein